MTDSTTPMTDSTTPMRMTNGADVTTVGGFGCDCDDVGLQG